MSRLQVGALQLAIAEVGARRDRRAARWSAWASARGSVVVDVPDDLAPTCASIRRCSSARSRTSSTTRSPGRRPTSRSASRPARRRDQLLLRVIDRGPGHPDRPTGSWCSNRSSGSAIARAAVSGSGSRSRAASPRRSAATCPSKTRPAAARRWCSRSRSRRARPDRGEHGARHRGRGGAAARAAHLPGSARLRGRLAATGAEGLDLAAREHPDVVILDLGLPDMDGVDVATRAARLEHGSDRRALRARRRVGQGRRARRRAPTTT